MSRTYRRLLWAWLGANVAFVPVAVIASLVEFVQQDNRTGVAWMLGAMLSVVCSIPAALQLDAYVADPETEGRWEWRWD